MRWPPPVRPSSHMPRLDPTSRARCARWPPSRACKPGNRGEESSRRARFGEGASMAFVDWRMQGIQVSNCNCAVGCPCQFNALPTHGHCRACMFVQIDEGHFGKVSLDGLRWGGLFSWPGPIHLGNGTAMAVIDERANADQRAALEAIAQGRETEPGSLITQVFSTTITKGLPTQFKSIELSIDEKAGTARVRVPGLIESTVKPIENPVTGDPHRVRVML